jgi:thaumarchaeosortase
MTFLKKWGLEAPDFYVAASLAPILGLAVLDPRSFTLGWNEGRGGFVFALFFLLVEWYDARGIMKIRMSKSRLVGWVTCLAGFIAYFVAVYALGLHELIGYIGEVWKVPELHSWVWLWDYLVLAVYLCTLFAVLFGVKSIKQTPTPIVYTMGSCVILLLDSFFPYESIGFLAGMAPFIANIVVSLLGISGVHVMKGPYDPTQIPSVFLSGNFLWMRGLPGSVILQINWPCMGIFSMLIYILIMAILMIKLEAPRRRKLLYLVIGAVGTFFINVFRIFLIAYYVAFISIDIKIFHENIGEFLFLAWVVVFLLAIVKVESRLVRTSNKIGLSKESIATPKMERF